MLQARRLGGTALAAAEAAAEKLETFAAVSLGLRIRVDGTGLSRTLVVDLVEDPHVAALAARVEQPRLSENASEAGTPIPVDAELMAELALKAAPRGNRSGLSLATWCAVSGRRGATEDLAVGPAADLPPRRRRQRDFSSRCARGGPARAWKPAGVDPVGD